MGCVSMYEDALKRFEGLRHEANELANEFLIKVSEDQNNAVAIRRHARELRGQVLRYMRDINVRFTRMVRHLEREHDQELRKFRAKDGYLPPLRPGKRHSEFDARRRRQQMEILRADNRRLVRERDKALKLKCELVDEVAALRDEVGRLHPSSAVND